MHTNSSTIRESSLVLNIHTLPEMVNANSRKVNSQLRNLLKSHKEIVMLKLMPYRNNQSPLPLMLANGHLIAVVSSAIAELN